MTDDTQRTTVVHCKREPFDAYIGRGPCPKTGRVGNWGNPFTVKVHGYAALTKFVDMLGELHEEELIRMMRPLQGKVLGCWCAPGPCHGTVLARLANGVPLEVVRAWAEQVVAEATGATQLPLFADQVE